ncbi:MAG: hypothetical protein AAF654_05195 [Myxococcota bacterium]
MRIFRSASSLAVLCLLAAACSDTAIEAGPDTNRSTAIQDIKLLSIRDDGRFDIICQNGDLEIRTAEEIQNNEVCEKTDTGVLGLLCTSRDNDGIDPWVVAVVGGGGVTRYRNVVYSTLGSCRNAIASAITRDEDAYICGSRDRDGVNPWSLFHLDDRATRMSSVVFRELDSCINGLNTSVGTDSSLELCAPRDGDDVAPWRQYSLSGTNVDTRSGNFQELRSCVDDLESRHDPDGRLLCVARDNDGRDPWIIAERIGINVTRFRQTVYGTRADCDAGIDGAREFSGQRWVCTSRDRDGRSPYTLTPLMENRLGTDLIYGSLSECLGALDDAVDTFDGTLVCSSRDRDGRDPWNIYTIDENMNVDRTSLSYRSIADCTEQL